MNVMKSGVKQAKPKIQSKIAVFEDGRKKAQVTEKSVQTEDVGSQIKAMTSGNNYFSCKAVMFPTCFCALHFQMT